MVASNKGSRTVIALVQNRAGVLARICRRLAGLRRPLLSPCFREELCRALLADRLAGWSTGGRDGFLRSRPPARAILSPDQL